MANYKWLWSHVRKIKGLYGLSFLVLFCEALSNVATIALQQKMIDRVMIGGQTDKFWFILLQLGIAYLTYSILFTIGPHLLQHSIAKMRTSMGIELMKHIFRIPVSVIQKERTAEYVYHFTQDLQVTAHFGASDFPRLFQQAVSVIAIIILVDKASPIILMVLLLFVLMYIIIGGYLAPIRKKISSGVNGHRSKLLIHLEEGVSSTREVIAFHREEWENRLYNKKFIAYFNSIVKEGEIINRQIMLSDPLKWGAVIFIFLYGGNLVLDNRLTIGMFVISFQFTTKLMDSCNSLYQAIMGLSGKFASVERICRLLAVETSPEGNETLKGPIQSICFRDISFKYQTQEVLRNLDLNFDSAKKIALVGSSGCGKSTIASLLIRFYDPHAGTILVNRQQFRNIRREDWMRKVTLVSQEPYFFPDTIRMNLLLGITHISEFRMIEMCKAMRIHDFIKDLPDGYDTKIGERGVALSGGQRQRLALARALLRDSEVLILDEATSALDLETERHVQSNLDRLRYQRMTIIIAHRLSTIRNADIIFVINQGSVSGTGTHAELLQDNPLYQSLLSGEKNKSDYIKWKSANDTGQ
ncbi:hypothetical protein A3844_26925 [Paenibacillus helianthi]|uniref:ABC transporter ATP-binding protein n=1 Tax=Paenibacillus helianthi TaxID=1349432 RepID=A0ABX3EIQ9_9BACL|nr:MULTISPECIES: ABC transporter ATP-binding protein [Paenibacillus]OKP80719.1 hypothetical protein A3844_26925 [Paenibacillus helianthi]OKP89129.1 hypothetical protein A3848_16635 [Paenibacillus sp. P32E]